MRLVFKELYLFSTQERSARRIDFIDGINVITSSQSNGTDRGKSVIMRAYIIQWEQMHCLTINGTRRIKFIF